LIISIRSSSTPSRYGRERTFLATEVGAKLHSSATAAAAALVASSRVRLVTGARRALTLFDHSGASDTAGDEGDCESSEVHI
jgi:hypothetical protein